MQWSVTLLLLGALIPTEVDLSQSVAHRAVSVEGRLSDRYGSVRWTSTQMSLLVICQVSVSTSV